MEAFGTSPHGLAIDPKRFWFLSFREFDARERIWKNARNEPRYQWAQVMAMLYNINRGNQPAKSASDWLPEEDRPPQKMPWEVDVEQQKINIRQALELAAAINAARGQPPN